MLCYYCSDSKTGKVTRRFLNRPQLSFGYDGKNPPITAPKDTREVHLTGGCRQHIIHTRESSPEEITRLVCTCSQGLRHRIPHVHHAIQNARRWAATNSYLFRHSGLRVQSLNLIRSPNSDPRAPSLPDRRPPESSNCAFAATSMSNALQSNHPGLAEVTGTHGIKSSPGFVDSADTGV